MKVLFMFTGLTHYYNPILNRLNRISGLEIIVVIPEKENQKNIGAGVHQTEEGIEFKLIHLKQYKSIYKFFFKGFDKVLKSERPDAIVTTFFYAYTFLYHLGIRKLINKYNIKLIYKDIPFRVPLYKDAPLHHARILGYHQDRFFLFNRLTLIMASLFSWITKKMYQQFDGFVNYVEKAFEVYGTYGINPDKIHLIYNSTDTEIIFNNKEKIKNLVPILPRNPYRLIHVGRLVEWKRVDLLINAVSKLQTQFPDIELIVIGKGPLLNTYKKLAVSLKVQDKIHFKGAVYDPLELGRYFSAAGIYVLGGMGGLSINEAMAYGLPVICSVCDGTEKHLVFENENGKYFKEGDLNDLMDKISFLLNDPVKMKKMGQKSSNIIQHKVNVHTVIKGYVKAFNTVSNNQFKLKYQPKEAVTV